MNKRGLLVFAIGIVFATVLIAGCARSDNANGNANRTANSNSRDDRNLSREDFEKAKDRFVKEARDLGRTVGTGADDLWIWTKTRSALAYADDLRDSTINVDVENNVVTLSGTVANDAQKNSAAEIARSIERVTNVVNNLQVSQGAASANRNGR